MKKNFWSAQCLDLLDPTPSPNKPTKTHHGSVSLCQDQFPRWLVPGCWAVCGSGFCDEQAAELFQALLVG